MAQAEDVLPRVGARVLGCHLASASRPVLTCSALVMLRFQFTLFCLGAGLNNGKFAQKLPRSALGVPRRSGSCVATKWVSAASAKSCRCAKTMPAGSFAKRLFKRGGILSDAGKPCRPTTTLHIAFHFLNYGGGYRVSVIKIWVCLAVFSQSPVANCNHFMRQDGVRGATIGLNCSSCRECS